jgi:hypothetical protein
VVREHRGSLDLADVKGFLVLARTPAGKARLGNVELRTRCEHAPVNGLLGAGKKAKHKKPDYKLHKKLARTKGDRGQQRGDEGFDGSSMAVGRKGGIIRVSGY